MSDCCGCGPGAAGGVGTGFEPVPECTEGAIHPWGIEGAQPEDRVSTSHVSKIRSNSYLEKRLHLTVESDSSTVSSKTSLALSTIARQI